MVKTEIMYNTVVYHVYIHMVKTEIMCTVVYHVNIWLRHIPLFIYKSVV